MRKERTHIIYVSKVDTLNTKTEELYFNHDKKYAVFAQQAFDLAKNYLLPYSPSYIHALNLYSIVLFNKGEMEPIVSILKNYVDKIDIDLLAADSKEKFASTLNNLAIAYHKLNKLELAGKYLQRSIRLKKEIGLDKRALLGPYDDLIDIYSELQQYDKIKTCLLDVQEIVREAYGASSKQYQGVVEDYIRLLDYVGDHTAARQVEENLRATAHGTNETPANPFSDEHLQRTQQAYAAENYEDAKVLHRQILASLADTPLQGILELAGESFDPLFEYVTELDEKAQRMKKEGAFDEALRCYRIMAEIVKNSWGDTSMKYALVLSNWAGVTREMNDATETERLLVSAVKISRLPLNRMHEVGGTIMDNFADFIYQQTLLYSSPADAAENVTQAYRNRDVPEDYERSLRIQFLIDTENLSRRELIIRELKARSVFYTSIGDLRIALNLTEDRTKISRLINIEKPDAVLKDMLDLHRQYLELGDFRKADALIREALDFAHDPVFEDDVWPLALAGQTAANFYAGIGDYEQSLTYFKGALSYLEQLDTEHPAVLHLKRDIVKLLLYLGRIEEATPYVEEFLSRADFFEEQDPVLLQENASILMQLNRFDQAEPLFIKAMTILKEKNGKWDMSYALAASNLATAYRYHGRFHEAVPLYEQAFRARKLELGELHPKLNETLIRLALTYAGNAEPEKALALMDHIEQIDNIQLDTLFSLTSDKQKFEVARRVSGNMHVYLSLMAAFYKDNDEQLLRCLNLLQKRKGNIVSHFNMIASAVAAADDPAVRNLYEQLKAINALISDGVHTNKWTGDPSSQQPLRDAVRRKEEIEQELSKHIEQVKYLDAAALVQRIEDIGPGVAVIEIVQYNRFIFNAVYARGEEVEEMSYGAFVVTNRNKPHVKFVELGASAEIDVWLEKVTSAVQNNEASLQVDLARISFVLEPVVELLDGITDLVVCPDGAFGLLPFDLLNVSNDQRWIDQFRLSFFESGITYLASIPMRTASMNPCAVVAYPDYFYMPGAGAHVGTTEAQYIPLDGSLQEGQEVMAKLKAKAFFGREATKADVLSLSSPFILHIATHGFYSNPAGDDLADPMVHAGLALAGANVGGEQSGILTAKEISFMDLRGTELVVLSACSTGQGEVVSGQGIFGLQQGFKQAGALRVLVALWKIPDWATRHFMDIFYTALQNNTSVGESLRLAKKQAISHYPKSFFWAAFILWGEGRSRLNAGLINA